MDILWQIHKEDITKVQEFYNQYRLNPFVQNRIKRNVERNFSDFSREYFWKAMVSCLLTTQQRSGPNSSVTKFICSEPFPLSYAECKINNLAHFVQKIISDFGGIRRAPTIGEELENNLNWLEAKGWETIKNMFEELKHGDSSELERKWAEFIIDSVLKGFGPKQSRNLLQSMGLTKYEIPIDSRITKWLDKFGFPLKLSASALADKYYYNFVLDGFQKLCKASDIYPCLLDAAIFSSFDEEWSEGRLIW
jgi:hypothetical protein